MARFHGLFVHQEKTLGGYQPSLGRGQVWWRPRMVCCCRFSRSLICKSMVCCYRSFAPWEILTSKLWDKYLTFQSLPGLKWDDGFLRGFITTASLMYSLSPQFVLPGMSAQFSLRLCSSPILQSVWPVTPLRHCFSQFVFREERALH